jgi:hypothetical protein
MSVLEKPLRCSVNLHLRNKNERRDTRALGEGWENTELTPAELAHFINKGVAYSVQVKGGVRRRENFIASDIASVDIDKGLRIEDALAHPFCQKHLTILYKTKSHTDEHHRFRLVFALPRTITKPTEQAAINKALAFRLGGDPGATDSVRICFGSDQQPPEVFDRCVTPELLDELIIEGKRNPQADSLNTPKRLASARGAYVLAADLQLTTSGGSLVRFGDIQEKTSVHCPHHADEHASAFVKFSNQGSKFLHCAVCQTTWWEAGKQPSTYDFDSWDRAVEAVKDDKFENVPRTLLFPDEDIDSPKLGKFTRKPKLTVTRLATKHLALESLPPGITFVKSPKGSGKTTTIVSVLDKLGNRTMRLDSVAEDGSSVEPALLDETFSVLLIGHRRALIRETCFRLGLNCYLDEEDGKFQENEKRKRHYGVCLDSLWKVRDRQYNLIIIDESEQVLGHLLAETLEHREGVFQIFQDLLRNAKRIVALDADLSWTSYGTLCKLGHAIKDKSKVATKHVNILYNKPQVEAREIFLFQSKDHLLADFEQQVCAGKKILLASNSKAKVDQIAALLRDKYPEVKMIAVTSDNSNSPEIQDFIVNIKERIAEYQVVLVSPSLGTGVDITLKPEAAPIDIVYGFFENLINTHFDIDQQLRRVRHPGAVRVWISPKTLGFETEFAAVKSDIESEKNGLVTLTWGPRLLDLAASVVARQRASKNRLKRNFIDYKTAQGWEVRDVLPDRDLVSRGKDAFTAGQMLRLQERVEQLLEAKPITQGEYLRIRECIDDDEEVTEAEMWSYHRGRIEAFYVQRVTPDLVALDLKGMRDKARVYEALIQQKTKEPWADTEMEKQKREELSLLPNHPAIPWLMHTLLSTTPVYKDHRFDTDAVYSCQDLGPFVQVVDKHKREIQNLLNKPIPKDLKKKPTSFLRFLLDLAGVKQINIGKKKQADGQVIYYYSADAESVRMLDEIVERRAQHPNRWEFVHELHGLDGALYERRFHATSSDGLRGVYYLVPVTEGKAVKLKSTERKAKQFGFDPLMEAKLRESNERMKERFAARNASKNSATKAAEKKKKQRDAFKTWT